MTKEELKNIIKAVIKLLEEGALPKSASKRIFGEIKNQTNPLKILRLIKKNLPDEFFQGSVTARDISKSSPNKVILSECLVK